MLSQKAPIRPINPNKILLPPLAGWDAKHLLSFFRPADNKHLLPPAELLMVPETGDEPQARIWPALSAALSELRFSDADLLTTLLQVSANPESY